MNPAIWIIVAIVAIVAWLLLADYYKDVGEVVKDTVENAVNEMKEEKEDA